MNYVLNGMKELKGYRRSLKIRSNILQTLGASGVLVMRFSYNLFVLVRNRPDAFLTIFFFNSFFHFNRKKSNYDSLDGMLELFLYLFARLKVCCLDFRLKCLVSYSVIRGRNMKQFDSYVVSNSNLRCALNVLFASNLSLDVYNRSIHACVIYSNQ